MIDASLIITDELHCRNARLHHDRCTDRGLEPEVRTPLQPSALPSSSKVQIGSL